MNDDYLKYKPFIVRDGKGESKKDWTDDLAHENGDYTNRCTECKELFFGHKHRVICKECSSN